jgi:adenylate cyclase
MAPQDLERKLTAILSADVEGYSRLMRDDEEATVRTLTDYRRTMASLIQQYRGRVVDSPGDNLLAEFASVVDAVNCAVEIQRELAKRNAELPEDRRMDFRIGLNLGDVVTEGERIYGDGVNIAARMEGLAEGGGICLSGTVYDAIENKIGLEYEDLGQQEVKNISKPVRAYRVVMGKEGGQKKTSRVWRKVAIALGLIVVLLAGTAGVIWNVYFRLPEVKGVTSGMEDFELPEGPSVAVLPFVNMSGDPEQEYFSDGLTDTIISGLSAVRGLLVIARNSTFVYKDRPVKVQNVARELGAQYVVEGSVQKTKHRGRITVQLIDASTGHHVWSDTYEKDLKDIFALQDEITLEIMRAVGMEIVGGGQAGVVSPPPSGSLKVVMKGAKALEYLYRFNKEDNILGRQELEEAIALDPEYAVLYSMLAISHFMDLWYQTSESPLISFAQASKNTKKALALNDEDWGAHFALSHFYFFRNEHDKAIASAERAIALNPNAAEAYSLLGFLLTYFGNTEEGIRLLEKAIRLNPIFPAQYLHLLGNAYWFLGQYEDSIELYKKVLKRSPNHLLAHINLTATYSASGRQEEARQQAQELLRLDPAFSLDRWAERVSPLFEDKSQAEQYIADLRKAGLK